MSEVSDSANSDRQNQSSKVVDLVRRLSSATEKGYTGAFSYAAEYHAAAVAFGVGLAGTPQQQRQVVGYALGRGGVKKQKTDAHLKDVADEPAYALAALAVAKSIKSGTALPF